MPILDRSGRVWVTTSDADKLYREAKEALREFDNLHGSDLFEDEGFAGLVKAMHRVRKVLAKVDSL